MENIDKPKVKIPLFKNEIKTRNQNYKGNQILSDSSDSNIFEDSSDNDINEDKKVLFSPKLPEIHTMANIKSLSNDISRSVKNIFESKTIDNFKEIEDYLANSPIKNKNKNVINENKEKTTEKKNNKKFKIKDKDKDKDKNKIKTKDKGSQKIIKDFFINKEGDIESSEIKVNNLDNNQRSNIKHKTNNVIKNIGPLMEEDINSGVVLIDNNKLIFTSVKELWKFQKILLENQIIDIKSKKYIIIFFIYSVKRNLFIIIYK
jgi:hypothetical protein